MFNKPKQTLNEGHSSAEQFSQHYLFVYIFQNYDLQTQNPDKVSVIILKNNNNKKKRNF